MVTGDWLVCRLNGETYTHKPPGFFWSAALANVLGASWTTAAKIPSVLAAAGAAALLFDLARRLYGRVAAWTAALALVTTKEYFTICIRGQLDPLVSFWTTLATYGFARAVLFAETERERTRWTAVAFLAAGCGMMVKGPVAYAIPGAAALVALLWDDRWREIAGWRWVAGVVVLVVPPADYGVTWLGSASLVARFAAFVVVTGCWRCDWRALRTWRWALAPLAFLPGAIWAVAAAARAPEGWGYISALALGQGVGHAAGQVDKLEPWWFYARTFPMGLIPWVPLLPAAIWTWRAYAAPGRRLEDRVAMAWLVAPVVVMSLSLGKRDLYLVPVFPAAALLLGRLAMTLSADESRLARRPVAWGIAVMGWAGLVTGAALVVFGVSRLTDSDDWIARHWPDWDAVHERIPGSVPTASVVLGAGVAIAAVLLLRARRFASVARPLAATMLLLTAATGLIYAQYTDALASPRAFLEKVKTRIGDAYLGDYGGTSYAANWICERSVVPMIESRPAAERVLLATPGRVYFTVDRDRLRKRGLPAGSSVLFEDTCPGPDGLVLIGRE